MTSLLAIDLGLKAGLALYGDDGRLVWYRSKNFGSAARLKRGVRGILSDIPDLAWLVIEGGGPLAEILVKEGEWQGLHIKQVSAETWRKDLLLPREQRSSAKAKGSADDLARRVIDWSAAARPTSLRHDAAEAILIGLWGVLSIGWLESLPREVRG
jgi:hypothetical protein